jgi:hypothetical protein
MSYEQFKPVVWSSHIQHELPKFTTYKQDCNFEFEGEAGKGKRVKILGVSRPTIKKYTPGVDIDSPEIPEDTSVYLDINQYDYFNYAVDNIDKAQATKGLMSALSEETTRALAEAEDTFCAKEIALGAGYKSATTGITTADAAKTAIDKLFVQLWKNGVSQKDILTLYLTPWLYDLLENKLTELKTDNDNLIAKGILGLYRNARVKMSNNAYNDGTDDHIILKTSKGFAYCNGIDELKPYSPEKSFADAIKGLNTYGGKAVRPKEIAVLKAHNS